MLPGGVELIDGGLAGLDLIRFIEGANRVVFVDSIIDFEFPGKLNIFSASEIAELAGNEFGHDAGLPYLLKILPQVIDGEIPEIILLGIEGIPNHEILEKAANLALTYALSGCVKRELAV